MQKREQIYLWRKKQDGTVIEGHPAHTVSIRHANLEKHLWVDLKIDFGTDKMHLFDSFLKKYFADKP